uniref:Acyl-protein synthetase LuxE domain-containing protein n=1 Tax=Thermofilum pendens TaxID=2269 RepID=A0A7J3X7P0_THEPE
MSSLPTFRELEERARESLFLSDPHVVRLRELSQDRSLFEKSPDYLAKLRRDLLRSSLDFFARNSDFYREHFERLGVEPRAAELEDLAKLAVPSDLLRGGGIERFYLPNRDEGGFTFRSSGTSGKDPVRVYRSPLELVMMTVANANLFEYVYGRFLEPGKGLALFLAAEELKNHLNFVAFVDLALQYKRIRLLYGMDLVPEESGGPLWKRLVPNKQRILEFVKSREEPKLFFSAPAGVHLISSQFGSLSPLKKMLYRIVAGAPPINLGRGGVIVTGGGSKGFQVPEYDVVVREARKVFKAVNPETGREEPVPFMDVLGMTETLTALLDRYGVMNKIPHPLQHVFLLDPKTYKPMGEDEYNKDGVLAIFDPLAVSWLEVFIPGDIVRQVPSERYYGREFVYVRRLTEEEGWSLQRACGGTLEELMYRGGGLR